MPKKKAAKKPWYGTYQELREKLRELGGVGCSVQECAEFYGVDLATLQTMLDERPSMQKAYLQGSAALKVKIRSAAIDIAVPGDDEDEGDYAAKDRIMAMRVLMGSIGIDKPASAEAGPVIETMAQLAQLEADLKEEEELAKLKLKAKQ